MKLSRLGGTDWAKTRKKVKAATEQMAKELIELYARRKQAHGYAFPDDDTWQGDFEQRFALSLIHIWGISSFFIRFKRFLRPKIRKYAKLYEINRNNTVIPAASDQNV